MLDQEVGIYLQEMALSGRNNASLEFSDCWQLSCVTLQIKEEELMLKHDINHWTSNLDHTHQTSYLHVNIGFSY